MTNIVNVSLAGFDLRRPLPNRFYGNAYAGVDDAGWDWPEAYKSGGDAPDNFGKDRNSGLLCKLSDLMEVKELLRLEVGSIIATGVPVPKMDREDFLLPPFEFELVHPSQVGSDWKLLGYDVATQWLESVFVTFGIAASLEKVPRTTPEGGICASLEEALSVCQEANSRGLDDIFFVFAVWLLPWP